MTQFYSRVTYSQGGSNIFTIPFDYIDDRHIKVYIDDTELEEGNNGFVFLNSTQIQITTTIPSGSEIKIMRATPIDEKIVTYRDTSMVLDDKNLNLSQDQLLNAVQEIYDDNEVFKDNLYNDNETFKEEIQAQVEHAIELGESIEDIQATLETKADSSALSNVATSGSYTDLSNKPTKLSDFTDDLGSSPTHTHSQYLTEHQDISGKANSADLSDVATSGSYNDLSNTPTKLSDFTDDLGSSPEHTHEQYITSTKGSYQAGSNIDIDVTLTEFNTPIQVGTSTWNKVIYANNNFVVLSSYGYSTSEFGLTWETPISLTHYPSDIAYGNGIYIIPCDSRYIKVGSDLGNLTEIRHDTETWHSVKYIDFLDTFILWNNTKYTTTSDGDAYSEPVAFGTNVIDINNSDNTIVAYFSDNTTKTTDDLITWSEAVSLPSVYTTSGAKLGYGNGLFYLVLNNNKHYTSEYGSTWSEINGNRETYNDILYVSDRFLMPCNSGVIKSSVATGKPTTYQTVGTTNWKSITSNDNYCVVVGWSGYIAINPMKEIISADLSSKQDVISDLSTIRSGASNGATAVQPNDLSTVATSGSYTDLSNKPTIPTVNNATLTITQGGVTKGTFTANASQNATIDLDAGGGGTSTDVQVNGTSITNNGVANLVTNTAYNSSSNKIATMSDIPSVPTKTSDLTNDSNFIANTTYVPTSVGIYGTAERNNSIAIGYTSSCGEIDSTAIGGNARANGIGSTAIGRDAQVDSSSSGAIQIGSGMNNTAKTLAIGFGYDLNNNALEYQLLDGTTGLIPDARLSSNIARTSDIPTVNNATLTITQGGTTKGTFTANASSDVTIDIDAGGLGTDVQVNGTSITNNGVANLVTNTAYDSSSNKIATMSDIPAAQVQANWNETNTSSKAYIQNKPTIPDAQIQSDWNQTTTTAKDYIKNKPTIPTVPTNVSAFTNDAGYTTNTGTVTSVNNVSPVNGNVSLTIPTNTNQLTNGAGFITSSDLSGYQLIAQPFYMLQISGAYSLTDNTIYDLRPTGNVTFTLPTITNTTVLHQIFIQVNMSTVRTISLGTSYYFNKTAPDMSTTGTYNLIYEYDNANSHWVVGCIAKGAAS